MNRLFKVLTLVFIGLIASNCKKDDGPSAPNIEPLRERHEVYKENLSDIENYLKKNYMKFENGILTLDSIQNNETSIWDQNEFKLQSINMKNDEWDLLDLTPLYENRPYLKSRYLKVNDTVDYKVYYVILNEGGGESPIVIDSVLTKHKRFNLKNEISFKKTEEGMENETWSSYPRTILEAQRKAKAPLIINSGFRQILKQIKTADEITENGNGTYTFNNAGRILVFLPSGLAYFNNSTYNKIDKYSPVIFDIELLKKQSRDHDRDGILSIYEDLNSDGDYFNDDTDGDRIPDFLDIDDDGDGFITRQEISYKEKDEYGREITKTYDFDKIPTCNEGKKRHLDAKCFPKPDGTWN